VFPALENNPTDITEYNVAQSDRGGDTVTALTPSIDTRPSLPSLDSILTSLPAPRNTPNGSTIGVDPSLHRPANRRTNSWGEQSRLPTFLDKIDSQTTGTKEQIDGFLKTLKGGKKALETGTKLVSIEALNAYQDLLPNLNEFKKATAAGDEALAAMTKRYGDAQGNVRIGDIKSAYDVSKFGKILTGVGYGLELTQSTMAVISSYEEGGWTEAAYTALGRATKFAANKYVIGAGGAKLGAAIGTFIAPGLGTVVGGILGGVVAPLVVDLAANEFFGKDYYTKAWKSVVNAGKSAFELGSETAKSVSDWLDTLDEFSRPTIRPPPTGLAEKIQFAQELNRDIQYAGLADEVYKDEGAPPGWSRQETWKDDGIGFYAAIFEDNVTGERVLTFRGTNFESGADWNSNFGNGMGAVTPQYAMAAAIAQDKNLDVDTITGHSLGGGLAQHAGAVTGIPTVTFNPAAVGRMNLLSCLATKCTEGNVRNYQHRNEILRNVVNPLTEGIADATPYTLFGTSALLGETVELGERTSIKDSIDSHEMKTVIEKMDTRLAEEQDQILRLERENVALAERKNMTELEKTLDLPEGSLTGDQPSMNLPKSVFDVLNEGTGTNATPEGNTSQNSTGSIDLSNLPTVSKPGQENPTPGNSAKSPGGENQTGSSEGPESFYTRLLKNVMTSKEQGN
jgi:hypothetical protein